MLCVTNFRTSDFRKDFYHDLFIDDYLIIRAAESILTHFQPDKVSIWGLFTAVFLKSIQTPNFRLSFKLQYYLLWAESQVMKLQPLLPEHIYNPNTRVAKVVRVHDDLLKQWRPIKMSRFRANIFLIRTTSNYFWASEVSKYQVFKSQFFSSSHASNQWIMKIW